MKTTRTTSFAVAVAAGVMMTAATAAQAATADVPVKQSEQTSPFSGGGVFRLILSSPADEALSTFRTAANRTGSRARFAAPRRQIRQQPVALPRQFGTLRQQQTAAPRSGRGTLEFYGFQHEITSPRDAPTPPPPPPPPPQHNDDCMSCD